MSARIVLRQAVLALVFARESIAFNLSGPAGITRGVLLPWRRKGLG